MFDTLPNGETSFDSLIPFLDGTRIDRILRLIKNPAGVLAAAFPYYAGNTRGNISIYARGRDYHLTVHEILSDKCGALERAHPGSTFIPLVDASPIPEVCAGALCGIGFIGKNNLLINPEYGSYIFIGCILTDINIKKRDSIKTCEGCRECIGSCPTGALSDSGFDKSKCLSHITQKRGELSAREKESLKRGGLIWGCDICQKACPHNKNPKTTDIRSFKENLICSLTSSELYGDDISFKNRFPGRAFTWRGAAPLIRNLEVLNFME